MSEIRLNLSERVDFVRHCSLADFRASAVRCRQTSVFCQLRCESIRGAPSISFRQPDLLRRRLAVAGKGRTNQPHVDALRTPEHMHCAVAHLRVPLHPTHSNVVFSRRPSDMLKETITVNLRSFPSCSQSCLDKDYVSTIIPVILCLYLQYVG